MYEGWNFYGLEMGWKLSPLPTANDLINHAHVIITSIKAQKGEKKKKETSNLHDGVKSSLKYVLVVPCPFPWHLSEL